MTLSRNTISVGIERMAKALANSCCSSVFTLANTTPGCASEACSYTGAKPLQGPHHGAQKSTTTRGFSLTVFSKFSWVRSIVAIAVLSEKSVQCTLDTHVCRPVRAVSDRAAALRLAGRRARQLARCARGGRTRGSAHRGSGSAARAARRRRPDPARARKPRARVGRAGGLSKQAPHALPRRARKPCRQDLCLRLQQERGRRFRPRYELGRCLSRNLPQWPAGREDPSGLAHEDHGRADTLRGPCAR